MPLFDPVSLSDPCMKHPERAAMQKFNEHIDEAFDDVGGDMDDVVQLLLTDAAGSSDMLDYFQHVTAGDDVDLSTSYVPMHRPSIPIELTTDMALGGGIYTASAKQLTWGGSSYSVTGNAATITDVFGEWWYALSGSRGWVTRETISGRNVLCPLRLAIPYIRTGVLNTTDLAATSLASPANPQTVTVDGVNFSVYGVLIPTGKELVKSSTTYVSFYPDFVAKKYFAISTNVCATTP